MPNNVLTNGIEHASITFLIILLLLLLVNNCNAVITEKNRLELKALTKEMFYHGWENYYQHAFPEDELCPFSCKGRGSDKTNLRNDINDVLGDYSLTLVDTLDTLAIIGTQDEFEEAVNRVIQTVSFHQDNKVQIFELNIRALGGLLSAHMFATDPAFNHTIKGYKNELLHMAEDLADRLMPAFKSTRTGIPYPRVNLKRGVPPTETTETCTAGAGSLILEFGVLSRLTHNPIYEQAAKKALQAVWRRRSNIDLLGNVIDIQSGNWIHTASSTGAGIDSIFEYMLKAYVLFGEEEYKDMFDEAYKALLLHVRDPTGYLYRNVHMSTGSLMSSWIDSLSAFFPGLQVLYGDLDSAIKGHLVYYNIWKKYHALPERFDFFNKMVDLPNYPLRPEFVESTYHLYMATRDPFYLEVGKMIVHDLNNSTRLPCGFASIGNVQTGSLDNRMESFMLSETLKYLYLLFDSDNPINTMDSNFIFTTEGHIMPLQKKYLQKTPPTTFKKKYAVSLQTTASDICQKYDPTNVGYSIIPNELDMSSIPFRPQADYAKEIVGYYASSTTPLSQHGYCESPLAASRKFSLSFGHGDNIVTAQQQGSNTFSSKGNHIIESVSGYLIKSLSGLRVDIIRKNDGSYLVKGVSPPYISLHEDSLLTLPVATLLPFVQSQPDLLSLVVNQPELTSQTRNYLNAAHEVNIRSQDAEKCFEYMGIRSDFSPDFNLFNPIVTEKGLMFRDRSRLFACQEFSKSDYSLVQGKILLVSRGYCDFIDKVIHAEKAGAKAVILLDNQEEPDATFRVVVAPSTKRATLPSIPSLLLSQRDAFELTRSGILEFTQLMQLAPIYQDSYSRVRLLYKGDKVNNIRIA